LNRVNLYPIWVGLSGRRVVVAGGGTVAERKIKRLRSVGADITVVSPHLTPGLKSLARRKRIDWRRRAYRKGDLSDAVLAFAATDNPDVNRRIAREAAAGRVWVNVATDPSISTFHLPALFSQGEIQLAISTGGKSPALAARLKEELSSAIDPAYGVLSDLLGEVRSFLKRSKKDQKTRAELLRTLVSRRELNLLDLIRKALLLPEAKRDWKPVNDRVRRTIGDFRFSFAVGAADDGPIRGKKGREGVSNREEEDDIEEG
jgi:precorrin-2 dehydrogenase/sirohydrochlorin ferrochelatase